MHLVYLPHQKVQKQRFTQYKCAKNKEQVIKFWIIDQNIECIFNQFNVDHSDGNLFGTHLQIECIC